jgi:hypothetical protein
MIKQIIAAVLLLTIFGLTAVSASFGQDPRSKKEQQTEKVKDKIRKLGLGERVKVKVKLYDATEFQGWVKEANADDFVIIDKTGNPNVVKYADVKSVGGKNFSTGAKIAIGIGIGVGATILALLIIIASLD